MNQKQDNGEVSSQEIVDLVVSRLETIPPSVSISIGSHGSFTIDDLIRKVRDGDEIGKKVIEMQLAYLRSLSNLGSPVDNAFADH